MACFTWKIFTAHRTSDTVYMDWKHVFIDEHNQIIEVLIDDSKTGPTTATITASKYEWMSPYHLLMKYFSHFPIEERKGRVWRRWVESKNGGHITNKPIGKNTMSTMVQELLT